ncbi:ISL3 family transposase [Geotalea uraniireducens]|uniref:Transposase, IS204/IS1001/IS1096/IS1165 family protein n=1 Tax=Geotalea uraniireducens (strain Rf4) TaxID=351605 RepID=A5G4C3_GEOUR|nr:ISL3 family transposase [Geotalea uraniireducens]ABQ26641.1 transposase, IS204/IS1001/IS1096/IS1165 family protein [Geotalea uraniireducens Rf4]
MQPEALFGVALGIVPPWEVTEVTFSKESNRLDITIDFQRGATFPCPVCGAPAPAYDTTEKEWRHLNFFQYEAYIHAWVPRVNCPNEGCGVKQIQVPWARAGSGFTLLFEALVMTMARDLPVNVMARLFSVTDTRLWRIINAYVEMARAKEDFSDVKRIGIDETSVKKGHDYVTFFFDLDQKKLLFGTEGKDNETVKDFVADLAKHGGDPEQITDAAIDMSKAFIKGVKEQLPNAVTTFDKFHLIKLMNEAMGKIRAEEARQFPEILKKSRFLFLKNPENLTPEDQERLDTIVANQCHKSVEAYTHKLNLQNVYFAESRHEAEALLTQWHKSASKSSLWLIKKMSRTVNEHWDGILSHFDSGLTTGFLEGVNSLIQAAKARARGYRNPRNMISMAYLIAGRLKFNRLYALPT